MLTYFEKDFVVIKYDAANQIIIHKWLIPPTSEEFREGMNALLDAFEHFETGKVLADTRYLGIILSVDQEWTITDWFERAIKVGYSHIAFILPQEDFTQIAVKDIMEMLSIPTAYFNNVESARLWLKQSKITSINNL